MKLGNKHALMGPLSGGTFPPGHCARVSRFQMDCPAVSSGEADVIRAKGARHAKKATSTTLQAIFSCNSLSRSGKYNEETVRDNVAK